MLQLSVSNSSKVNLILTFATCSLVLLQLSYSQFMMDSIRFENSDKNIPIHSKQTYCKAFIDAVAKLNRNVRWAALFFLNPSERPQKKENYGFKSIKAAPPVKELKHFEDGLSKLTQNLEFKPRSNQFQAGLKKEINKVNKSNKVYVPADKTSNTYLLEPQKYKDLLDKNVQKDYKKEDPKNIEKVDDVHRKIVKELDIHERVFETTKRKAFFTLKDHKTNFASNPQVRVLNPTKPELGKVSKKILEKIVKAVKSKTKLVLWKNSYELIEDFKKINNKKGCKFIQYDIDNYYGSISLELLENTLDWAANFVDISPQEREIILETKRSFLYTGDTAWVKKGNSQFNIAMGAFDGAETTDIVGLYLLSQLKEISENSDFEISNNLYRDDGLSWTNATARTTEKIKQKIANVFKRNGLNVSIVANSKQVDFLDVTLNMDTGVFKPFIKPGDKPLYVNSDSNHPPCVIKNIPKGINQRLSSISSSKEVFDRAAPLYQSELDRIGYTH